MLYYTDAVPNQGYLLNPCIRDSRTGDAWSIMSSHSIDASVDWRFTEGEQTLWWMFDDKLWTRFVYCCLSVHIYDKEIAK